MLTVQYVSLLLLLCVASEYTHSLEGFVHGDCHVVRDPQTRRLRVHTRESQDGELMLPMRAPSELKASVNTANVMEKIGNYARWAHDSATVAHDGDNNNSSNSWGATQKAAAPGGGEGKKPCCHVSAVAVGEGDGDEQEGQVVGVNVDGALSVAAAAVWAGAVPKVTGMVQPVDTS